MNKVIMTGRTTKDAELRYASTGTAVANFTLAVDRGFGENKKTDFWRCVVWKGQAELVAERVGKGSKILIEGEIGINEWEDREGNKRKDPEITVQRVEFIDLKNEQRQREPGEDDF